MEKYSAEVDHYLENAQEFARPVLSYLRETVHEVCPEATETIKWRYPTFMYNGKILCSLVGFKNYCSMGFWLHSEMKTLQELKLKVEASPSSSLGKVTRTEELPSKAQLTKCILEAMELTDMGVKPNMKAAPSSVPDLPGDFAAALKENPAADSIFTAASPSFRKEYILWITDAKTEVTRQKRMTQAVEWISEKKGRNWKYEKKK